MRRLMCLLISCSLAAAQGQHESALRLAGAASALREAIGAPLTRAQQSKLDQALEPARRRLGEVRAAAAWAEGRAMTVDAAVDHALALTEKP